MLINGILLTTRQRLYLFSHIFHVKFCDQFVYTYIRYQKLRKTPEKKHPCTITSSFSKQLSLFQRERQKVSYHGRVTFKEKTWQPDKLCTIYRGIQGIYSIYFPVLWRKLFILEGQSWLRKEDSDWKQTMLLALLMWRSPDFWVFTYRVRWLN